MEHMTQKQERTVAILQDLMQSIPGNWEYTVEVKEWESFATMTYTDVSVTHIVYVLPDGSLDSPGRGN